MAPTPLPKNCYKKRPQLALYDTPLAPNDDKTWPSKVLLREVRMLESLKHHPHPNIAAYRSCVVENGRITGVCYTGHALTLVGRVKDDTQSFDHEKRLEGIQDGIYHLHSLGMAHTILTPYCNVG